MVLSIESGVFVEGNVCGSETLVVFLRRSQEAILPAPATSPKERAAAAVNVSF